LNTCRFFSLLLVVILLFSAVSCHQSEAPVGTEPPNSPPPDTDPINDGRSYSDLIPREFSTTRNQYFGKNSDSKVLQLQIPQNWSCQPTSNGGQALIRDGEEIGEVRMGELPLPHGFLLVKSDENTYEGVRCEWSILEDASQYAAEDRYHHRYIYYYSSDGETRAVTLTVRYMEVHDFLSRKLRVGAAVLPRATDSSLGSISLPSSARGKSVLILGNSFIGTSQIGNALQDMFDAAGASYSVTAVSVGYATVSKSWSGYLSRMRNGEFAAVFMCGFYSGTDVNAFSPYVDACNVSNTPIVIFPAHNEGSGNQAAQSYPNVHFLNWKEEINALIENGVDYWDFCMDDTHRHSKPLAGYVGAHMIFRALFGRVPPQTAHYGSLSHQQVSSLLGEYISTGFVVLIPDSKIIFWE